jgi:hypothetical protein
MPSPCEPDRQTGKHDAAKAEQTEKDLADALLPPGFYPRTFLSGGAVLGKNDDDMRQRVDDLNRRGREREAKGLPKHWDIERDHVELPNWYDH